MAEPIFRVDLNNEARDFRHIATEPGLGMLDRTGANYAIMERWFGTIIAEPEWRDKDRVSFFVKTKEDARMDDLEIYSATKEDIEGPLNDQFNEIQARLKKARPDTPAEQTLHRVLRKNFNGFTADLEQGDQEFFLFKYREGREAWRLVWCWGYQRSDLEPGTAVICSNGDCKQLLVKHPKTKAQCPNCETYTAGANKPANRFLGIRDRTWMAATGLLLLLLLGFCIYGGWPTLTVTPPEWKGPQGSTVAYEVQQRSWYFFKTDVTDKVAPVVEPAQILEFDPIELKARARTPGRASITFNYAGKEITTTVVVEPLPPPKSIVIEPKDIKLVVGSTQQVKVMGQYEGLDPVDITDQVVWSVDDSSVVSARTNSVEGVAPGESKLNAFYTLDRTTEETIRAEAAVTVVQGEYQSITVSLEPGSVDIGGKAKIAVSGDDAQGNTYDISTSSYLKLAVEPEGAASIKDGLLTGRLPGGAKIVATLFPPEGKSLTDDFDLTVNSESAVDGLEVYPSEVDMVVFEGFLLDIRVSNYDEPVEIISSDPSIVDRYLDSDILAGRKPGSAVVTVRHGQQTKEVQVTVTEGNIGSIAIVPQNINLRVGGQQDIRVEGMLVEGSESEGTFKEIRKFLVVPDALFWSKQPKSVNVSFDRETLGMTGLKATFEPQQVLALLAEEHSALGYVSVATGGSVTDIASMGIEAFGVHPPIALGAGMRYLNGDYLGGRSLVYGSDGLRVADGLGDDSILRRAGLRSGNSIIEVDGYSLAGLTPQEIEEYFRTHPFVDGTRLKYVTGTGDVASTLLRSEINPSTNLPIILVEAKALNVNATDLNAELLVKVLLAGNYRVVELSGEQPLTDWKPLEAQSQAIFRTGKIARKPSDEYKVLIERDIDGRINSYEATFQLEY